MNTEETSGDWKRSSSIFPKDPRTEEQTGLSSGGVAGLAIVYIVLGLRWYFGSLSCVQERSVSYNRMGPPPMKFS